GRGNVQPALAAVAQQRPPLVPHPPVGVLAVADRQDDRVALVALDTLEVLDEEWLRPVVGEERLEFWRVPECLAQRGIDALSVLGSGGRSGGATVRAWSWRAKVSAHPPPRLRGCPSPLGLFLASPNPRHAAGGRRGPLRGMLSARRRRCARSRTRRAARPC